MSTKRQERYLTAISVLQDLVETDQEDKVLNPIIIYLKEKAQVLKKSSSIEEIEVNDAQVLFKDNAKKVWFI